MKPKSLNLSQQIQYIATSIEKGGYDASELIEKLDDAIQETRKITFKYRAKSVHPDLKEHLKTFTSYGKRNKARVIATLQDVQCELHNVKPKNRFMLSQLEQIEETTFFADKLQKKMMLDAVISRSKTELQNEIVAVS